MEQNNLTNNIMRARAKNKARSAGNVLLTDTIATLEGKNTLGQLEHKEEIANQADAKVPLSPSPLIRMNEGVKE